MSSSEDEYRQRRAVIEGTADTSASFDVLRRKAMLRCADRAEQLLRTTGNSPLSEPDATHLLALQVAAFWYFPQPEVN